MYDMRTLIDQVDKSLVTERLMALLSAAFGGLATILAAMGLYGVMAYVVSRRTREIGIRMALGADRGSVVWLVMREVSVLAVVGVAIGLGSSWALTRLVESQLKCDRRIRSRWSQRRLELRRSRCWRGICRRGGLRGSIRLQRCGLSEQYHCWFQNARSSCLFVLASIWILWAWAKSKAAASGVA